MIELKSPKNDLHEFGISLYNKISLVKKRLDPIVRVTSRVLLFMHMLDGLVPQKCMRINNEKFLIE